jgi:hypothetical protein
MYLEVKYLQMIPSTTVALKQTFSTNPIPNRTAVVTSLFKQNLFIFADVAKYERKIETLHVKKSFKAGPLKFKLPLIPCSCHIYTAKCTFNKQTPHEPITT